VVFLVGRKTGRQTLHLPPCVSALYSERII